MNAFILELCITLQANSKHFTNFCFRVQCATMLTQGPWSSSSLLKFAEKGKRLDTMNSYEYWPEKRSRVLFLRVAYVLKHKQPLALPLEIPPLTYQNFYPFMVADRPYLKFQSAADTFARMQAWLKASGKWENTLSDYYFTL